MDGPEEEKAKAPPLRTPEPSYQLEWETRTPKPSLLSRLLPSRHGAPAEPKPVATAGTTHVAAAAAPAPRYATNDSLVAKETAPGTTLPFHNAHPAGLNPAHRPPLATRLRARFDSLLPPHKRYLGLRRRPFVLLLLALVLLAILAIALGAGLSRRASSSPSSAADLPLPGTERGRATQTGDLTFYAPGLGACGASHNGTDMVVAVAHSLYDAAARDTGDGNPNHNPLCGMKVRVFRGGQDAAQGVLVTVVDRCVGCQPTDLDLSPAAFGMVANEDEGRVVGRWVWA